MKKNKPAVRIIGLTGSVASGKTAAARIFRRLGAKIIDADRVNRELSAPSGILWRKTVDIFGPGILRSNGCINRRLLGNIVFSDVRKRRALEHVAHPAIIREIKRRISQLRATRKYPVIVLEAPLLFEAGADRLVDVSVVVWSPRAAQIERLKQRNGLDTRAASQRIAAHWASRKKMRRADKTLKNAGSIRDLDIKVRKLWGVLTK